MLFEYFSLLLEGLAEAEMKYKFQFSFFHSQILCKFKALLQENESAKAL